ncbi:MAG TPA: MotA/TolQ/ExbB proton channel family protein [Chitinophagaceae bacterium]|jgi:biopolymer transport protein ExbB|nr:MAG: colicin uptake protein TolQ [Bacteroidetes bacterium ADurb.BinA245]HMW66185.1 MotA/TolQ/ExbB proton channel family protein [Chitinophagaceae bacterium]HNA19435.1 MotA/TolQ/ExbB proton channel family protein [Chitinophagaceae bacterium]HNA90837.1 MotA/TolQ/ExbB proton channel family protein [Chitinophagaceae bacterium]HNF38770.1 MotA/TolQ/ExbB proton channel family protein [Chitinophagaceae bacterium]
MAEIKPTATASVKATSVQPKKSSNAISWIAPIICLIAGYGIWRFIFGNPDGFDVKGTGWFWPKHDKPKGALNGIYMGGIIVPILVGMFLMVVVFSIERYLTIRRALGNGSISDFIRKIQYHLANRNVDAALSECDKQRGSVGNVMKAGLRRYKEMINEGGLNTEQKVISIQKEVEEATALELPMLQKNLVFLSTITSVGTLIALLGTVMGMIRSFSALGDEGGGGAGASALAIGISEALYNTALGIGTSAIALVMYNIFTTKIDSITYGIDESGFTLTQSFASLYK